VTDENNQPQIAIIQITTLKLPSLKSPHSNIYRSSVTQTKLNNNASHFSNKTLNFALGGPSKQCTKNHIPTLTVIIQI